MLIFSAMTQLDSVLNIESLNLQPIIAVISVKFKFFPVLEKHLDSRRQLLIDIRGLARLVVFENRVSNIKCRNAL
jgi:hypothetical protein